MRFGRVRPICWPMKCSRSAKRRRSDMDDFKFCEKCGAPSKRWWNGTYNTDTGEKNYESVCSADPCHNGHDEELVWPKWMFGVTRWHCKKCGKSGIASAL